MPYNEYLDFEFLLLKKCFGLSPTAQVLALVLLYILTIFGCFWAVKATGTMYGYPPNVSIIFAPIYEEIIFRGILLKYFDRNFGFVRAIIWVSVLFGIWHLKNIFWIDASTLTKQVLYTALFFSPITCWITWKTRSIWPAVIVHYLNNFPFDGWMIFFHWPK